MTLEDEIMKLQTYKMFEGEDTVYVRRDDILELLEQKPKIGHCKDCKWWKDSDGAFRRGIGAESQCPINREEVYEGNGYCFLFEPQEMETWNGIHAQITAPKGTFERIFNEADDENDI